MTFRLKPIFLGLGTACALMFAASLGFAEEAAAPAAAAAAAAAPAAPAAAPVLDTGATAWMLTSTALVLLMTIPGLALFYAGMVRKKNVLGTAMQSFAITCLVTVLWAVVGYSLAFTGDNPYIGSLDRFMMNGVEKTTLSNYGPIPETVFMCFQMTFAIITPALITGAFADRMKFSALLVFMALWSLVVYVPIAHWVWSANADGKPVGWLNVMGVLDFAGGTVVHINAGVAGLIAAIVIGPRKGFGQDNLAPHNLTLSLIGASLLWVGWFGFNAGSAVAADGRAGFAMAVTQVATAAAGLGWMAAEWITRGKPSVLGIISGAVAGLVAITPASGFVGIGGSLVIGLAAGVICFWGATGLKHALGYDDSLDAFGVHGIGGIVGALLTGVFAVEGIGGTKGVLEGNTDQLLIQAEGIASTLIYTAVVTFILLKIVDAVIGLRVTPEEEVEGLDLALHGETVH